MEKKTISNDSKTIRLQERNAYRSFNFLTIKRGIFQRFLNSNLRTNEMVKNQKSSPSIKVARIFFQNLDFSLQEVLTFFSK